MNIHFYGRDKRFDYFKGIRQKNSQTRVTQVTRK